ncbi:protein cfxQ [Dorcoceras hygrometricum]|uniref:Protein cfxQ n=1 Tax=Dorcoceras hygrometricum TaxID=472368 RepID=A0A2Z7D4Z0_9LAMI|nr:protein cfxQ [Dorcoceras hygrometricum]
MRIDDKNKYKNKNSSSGNSSDTVTIHSCAESGDLSGLVRFLVTNPSLVNERSTLILQTPLHASAGHNRYEIVKYLLEWRGSENVDLEATNVYGETPFHLAAKNGCVESARMLLDRGANVNARTNNQKTPLQLSVGFALRSGDNSIVKLLLQFNADCSAEDDEGKLAFNYIPTTGYEHEELRQLVRCGYGGHGNNNNDSTGYQNTEAPSNYNDDSFGIRAKMDEFEQELSKIVGLKTLKQQLKKWAKGVLLDEKRRAMGVDLGPRKLPHMAFLGNPGTGKTTVARILGKMLHSVGVLPSGNVIEVQRTDLVAEYLGQTGSKTRGKIEEAIGGILFVDEAYRLAPEQKGTGHSDYGFEALEEIMSVLEDGNLVVIFAGYTAPMKRVFSSNEGFFRRVTHHFQFDDYSSQDLAEMLMLNMTKQNQQSRLYGFKLESSCTFDAVVALIEKNTSEKLRNKMNGGLVDHLMNNARENLDSRLTFESKGDELFTIRLTDLEAGIKLLAASKGNI